MRKKKKGVPPYNNNKTVFVFFSFSFNIVINEIKLLFESFTNL